jgi:succinyl-diaminopimelate desuccinylase
MATDARTAQGTDGRSLDDRIAAACALLDERGLIEALRTLVRIPSVHDPDVPDGNERQAADYVATLLDAWGMPYTRREVAPNRPNIVVDLPGSRPGPVLIFEGHTDVVTAGDRAVWTVDPFGGEITDGRLYGRGACDMKGGLASTTPARFGWRSWPMKKV